MSVTSIQSRSWRYAFHWQCRSPSSFWTKNISPDLHFNDSTNLLFVAASADAYSMSNRSFVNTVWTHKLFFKITATKAHWSDLQELNLNYTSHWCNIRPLLPCSCTTCLQTISCFLWLAVFAANVNSYPLGSLFKPTGIFHTVRKRVKTIFGQTLPFTDLTCLPRAPRSFLRPLLPSACYVGYLFIYLQIRRTVLYKMSCLLEFFKVKCSS